MRTFCTYCGAANATGTAACYACGTPLEAPTPATPTNPAANLGAMATPPPATSPLGAAPPVVLGHEWQPPAPPLPPYQPPFAAQYPYPPANGYGQAPSPGGPGGAPPWPGPAGYPPPPGYGPPPPPGYGPPPQGYPYGAPPYQGPYVGQPYPGAPVAQQPGYPAPPPYPLIPGYAGLPAAYTSSQLAGAGPRFGAYLLDSIVVGLPMFLLLTLAGATDSIGLAMLSMLLAVFGPALYFIIAWASSGRTVGYRAMGLQLVRSDGTQPGAGAAITRYLGVFLCNLFFIPGLLGMLWMLWDNKRQGWHDKMADTLVIKS